MSSKYKLLFIHGWGGNRKSLMPLAAAAGRNLGMSLQMYGDGEVAVEVKVLELPGFGQTELEQPYEMADYVKWAEVEVDKFLDGDEEAQLVLVGHSFGGKILLNLLAADQYPSAQMILINTSGLKPHNSAKKRVFKTATTLYSPIKNLLHRIGLAPLQTLLQKLFYKFVVRASDYQRASSPELKQTLINVVDTHVDPDTLRKVPNHVLLLWGAEDRDTPLWMGEELASALPHAELRVVEGATHGLPLKQPEECAAEIVEFLISKLG